MYPVLGPVNSPANPSIARRGRLLRLRRPANNLAELQASGSPADRNGGSPMPQKDLVLILARDLADKLASAAFVVDRDGTLVYFNERCGEILGRTFAEVGEMKMDDWSTRFSPTTFEDEPIPPEGLALVRAINEHVPAHEKIRIRSADGATRGIAVTALPFFARRDEFVGAMAVFWEHAEDEGRGQAAP